MFFNAIVWDPSVGIDLGFFTVRYYSLMFLIAFTLGYFIMKRLYKHEGIPEEKLDPLFMYTVIATLVGARLGHVIFYQPELFVQDPLSIFLPMQFVPEFKFTGFRGLASHGAAIGIIIAMYLYSKRILKKNIQKSLENPPIPISVSFLRNWAKVFRGIPRNSMKLPVIFWCSSFFGSPIGKPTNASIWAISSDCS